jgi:MYXO-CTERM domain-containing protein
MQVRIDPMKGAKMKSTQLKRFGIGLVAAMVVTLGVASSAQALFPPPFYYPTEPAGEVTPPDPPCVPPPPCGSPCPPPPCGGGTGVATTPEPATMISGVIGLSVLAGFALRRRQAK